MKKELQTCLVAAPDTSSASHVAALLAGGGIAGCVELSPKRGWFAMARKSLEVGGTPLLVAIPSEKIGKPLLDLADMVSDLGGTTLVWGDREAHKTSAGPHWLVTRLLEQRGAIHVRSLPVLVEICRILTHLGAPSSPGVSVAGAGTELDRRLREVLSGRGVDVLTRKTSGALHLSTKKSGEINASHRGATMKMEHCDIAAIATSLTPGVIPALDPPEPEPPPFEVDRDMVSLIAQPPERLLSETTSKKLGAAFGISIPTENLCSSSSEASRFASRLKGSAHLKLVRPGLEGKQERGAVIGPVKGAAAVKRAYHSLEALGAALSPPRALGVLVSESQPPGARLWLRMQDHAVYGRLLIGGSGDRPGAVPGFALTADVNPVQAFRALGRLALGVSPAVQQKLAVQVSRFARMTLTLGESLSRAEIHPMACSPNGEAVTVDMLVGISG